MEEQDSPQSQLFQGSPTKISPSSSPRRPPACDGKGEDGGDTGESGVEKKNGEKALSGANGGINGFDLNQPLEEELVCTEKIEEGDSGDEKNEEESDSGDEKNEEEGDSGDEKNDEEGDSGDEKNDEEGDSGDEKNDGHQKKFRFDLNELPPDEDEDEDEVETSPEA